MSILTMNNYYKIEAKSKQITVDIISVLIINVLQVDD